MTLVLSAIADLVRPVGSPRDPRMELRLVSAAPALSHQHVLAGENPAAAALARRVDRPATPLLRESPHLLLAHGADIPGAVDAESPVLRRAVDESARSSHRRALRSVGHRSDHASS